jgi:hypothetical protein
MAAFAPSFDVVAVRAVWPYKQSFVCHTVVIMMDTDLTASSGATTESLPDEAYRRARERAEMLQGLYIHLLVFFVINAGLVAINWATRGDNGSWWFWWPLLIWVIGLVVHVVATIVPVFSPQWVEQRTQRTISKNGV